MMSSLELECVNHPGRSTRVRCSSCGDPICVKCMRETPVGMKCPACARQPLRVRYGKPRHYFAASAGGLAAAAAAGALLGFVRFGIFVSLLAGLAVGEVVYRASGRQSRAGFQLLAALVTVAGMGLGSVIVGIPLKAVLTPGWMITAGIAGFGAALRIRL